MPKFSVVISVYNKEKHIKDTLQSVIDQSYSDFEMIIVNDGSQDQSHQVIESIQDDRIRYIHLKENQGAAAARNRGIQESTGEYIALLDGDDLWEPHYLAEIIALTDSFPQHRVFATAVWIENKFDKELSKYSYHNPTDDVFLDLNYFESSMNNTILTSSSTVIHRSVFGDIGSYDTSIKSGQDTDLWIRIGMDYRVAFSTKPLVTYRYAPSSLFKSIRSVTDRPSFLKFLSEEKTRPALKKFVDINRYSLALRAKLWNEQHLANTYTDHIDLSNLNKRQRFLMNLPAPMLKLLFSINGILEKAGLRQSAF